MRRKMAKIAWKSLMMQVVWVMGIVMVLGASLAKSHTVHKRHDIIESSASIDSIGLPMSNETAVAMSSEHEAPILNDDGILDDVDDVPDAKDASAVASSGSIETNNVNNVVQSAAPTVNNGIEQNFDAHNNQTVATITASPTNHTKEFSQNESVENRLPSKASDKLTSRAPARVTTLSLKDSKRSEMPSTAPLPRFASTDTAEKPKRLDVKFVRSTERAVPDIDTSTMPVSHSTASHLSTLTASPRFSATETIRARISSVSPDSMAEKRAKYLSESSSPSSSSSSSPSGQSAESSWSDLKTIGEVHHNNVTLGKTVPPDESIVQVNGKLDSEEVIDKGVVDAAPSTEKIDEHETQLQKSNSSRIVAVQEDNSLSSFASATNRPSVTTTKSGHQITSGELQQDIPKVNATKQANGVVLSSTEREPNSFESTEKATESDIMTTTEDEMGTTILTDATTTESGDEMITTISQHDSTLSNTPSSGELVTTSAETTTTFVSTGDEKVAATTVWSAPTKGPNGQMQQEPTTPFARAEVTNATTPDVTKPLAKPTTPFHSSSTESDNISEIVVPKHVATQRMVPAPSTPPMTTASDKMESTPETVSTTSQTVTDPMLRKAVDAPAVTAPNHEHRTEIAPVPDGEPTDVNAMIAIGISAVAVVTLILLVGFLYVMRKRQKQLTYSQRCRPIGLDAYSLDNISIYNSVRRKSAIRSSKRAFGNAGFDDPGLKNNPLTISQLAIFSQKRVTINDEFRDIPTVTARIEEVPAGCEDKNRYANVVPLPESRVHLQQLDDDEKTEYINANFVKGPKDTTHYYIACQAPLEHTVIDFWRMIWEQNSRVIIMATDLTENGIEKCAEYLPSSFVIDNHVSFGDFQITLKNREVREKYAVSTVHLKNAGTKSWREITHFWYQWPENGVPTDEASVIAMLLEARSYLKMTTPEQSIENGGSATQESEIGNGHFDKSKSLQRIQGPLTVHCSPGTGRTGTIIACDIAIRSLEQPTRSVDIPQIVYFVRRGRASAVQTREQYEFIYKVSHVYATKLTGPSTDN